MSLIKIAGVQMDIQLADMHGNADRVVQHLRDTTANGTSLTVFPECTLSGYCFESMEETLECACAIDDPAVQSIVDLCRDLETMCVFGFLELDGSDETIRVFNSLVCAGPEGIAGLYRKAHLPTLGVDRFTTPGDRPFAIVETPGVNFGMNICYDISFPESARVLSLAGADLIVLPTNWPPGAGRVPDIMPNARALENHIYFMSVNRIGHERGFDFVGKSKVCDPTGADLAFADHGDPAIIYAEIDVNFAREKHRVAVPGLHEVHRINDRRPDLYGPISS